MTKLTTERLEKKIKSCIEIENCEVMMPLSAAQELLAFRNAAKNPIAWVVGDEEIADFKNGREVCVMRDCDDEQLDYLPLYAAPVLPKQPESESIMCWSCKKTITLTQRAEADGFCPLCDAEIELESAQPVIPEQNDFREKLIGLANHIASAANGIPFGWQDWADEIVTDLRSLASIAQPVIPERPELRYGDNVLWFLNELAAFDASDIDSDDFDVYGEDRNGMEGCATISITELAADAAKLLSAQPVSEPYKLHQGWIKGQFAYQDIFNAIGAAVVSKHPSIEISVKAFEDSMLAAAPAQDGKSASTELPNHFNLSTNSPVIPDGWKLVPIEPTAAMFHAFNDCDYGRKSMRERYIQMIEAAPAQESE